MTGPQHYAEAELFLRRAEDELYQYDGAKTGRAAVMAQIAHVHALLAHTVAASFETVAPDEHSWWEAVS